MATATNTNPSTAPLSTTEATPADAAPKLLTRSVSLSPADWWALARVATDHCRPEAPDGGQAEWLGRAVSATISTSQLGQTPLQGIGAEALAGVEPGPDEALTAYTDGACSGNPGPGGWGVVLVVEGPDGASRTEELSAGDPATTNNRMELTGAIRALEAVPAGAALSVIADSRYVCDGMTRWLDGWKRRNWRTADRKPVKNRELWERLDTLAQERTVSWSWIKGHAGNEHNERADMLAVQAIPARGRC